MADAISIAKEGIDAFNKGDWDHMRRLSAPNAVYVEVASGRRTDNVDDFIELGKGWRAGFPDVKGTVTSAVESGGTAVLEITWAGTHTGTLATPMGDIPATGKKTVTAAVEIVQTSGGKITEMKHYFDLMTLMTQLGLMPAATHA